MLIAKVERVQRRATKWILGYKEKDMSYHQRLQTLHLLPLCCDREIKDLTFFYKALYGYIDVNVNEYISFIGHGRTRHSQIPLVMKAPRCKTSTYQASYYNRIVKLWNTICKTAPVQRFSNVSSFKQLLKEKYLTLFNSSFDIDMPCTWTLSHDCACHWELTWAENWTLHVFVMLYRHTLIIVVIIINFNHLVYSYNGKAPRMGLKSRSRLCLLVRYYLFVHILNI
jgi:hypothetical protein